ncbi:UNKNOWN [Stylonychia lemnae]|uniref:Uncharacterized protein n=1 Tax=Stylonychia lemnae TaxID=5949 RepID=A0A078A1A4_STYLE|nr:UNKNOWN [Stylonychia lemnae]|eukprot:CDW75263.1 UNKNOWN [Stylonychia lemnae]
MAGNESAKAVKQPAKFKQKQFVPDVDKSHENKQKLNMPYKKYQLKNRNNHELRPFYLWKDGFIESYKKYCHQQPPPQVYPSQQQQKMPVLVQNAKSLNRTYQDGFFDSDFITKKRFVKGKYPSSNESRDGTKLRQVDEYRLQDTIDPLRTSLFNSKDVCSPVKKYFYDQEGMIQVEGKPKKEIGVRFFLENTEKLKRMIKFEKSILKREVSQTDRSDDRLLEDVLNKGRNNLLESLNIKVAKQKSDQRTMDTLRLEDQGEDPLINSKTFDTNKTNNPEFYITTSTNNNSIWSKYVPEKSYSQLNDSNRKPISPNPFKPKISVTSVTSKKSKNAKIINELNLSFNDYVSQAVNDNTFQNRLYKTFYNDAFERNVNARNKKQIRLTHKASTLDAHITLDQIETVSQIIPELDQNKCFGLSYQISDYHHESMISSLLQNWFMRNKLSEKNYIFNDSNTDFQIEIMNHIRQLNSKCHQSYLKELAETYKKIKEDFKEYENEQIKITAGTREEFIISLYDEELKKPRDTSEDPIQQSSVDISNTDFQIVINRSIKKLQISDRITTPQKSEQRNRTANDSQLKSKNELVIDQKRYEELFDKLYNCLFSKEELAVLQQTFKLILLCLGGSYSSFAKQPLKSEQAVAVFELYHISGIQKLSWGDFLKQIAKLRFEKLLAKIKKKDSQGESPKLSKGFVARIFNELLRIKITPNIFYKNENNHVSPLYKEKDRLSGITNSGDIVKVKDSNYVITDIADYTQYAQVSNKIDQSPNMIVGASQDHNFIQRLNRHTNMGAATTGGVFDIAYNMGGISPFQTSGINPIKTSLNDERLLHNNIMNGLGLPQQTNQKQITAIPSTSVFNYSLKSFNDGDQDEDDDQKIQLEDSYSEGFQIISKQCSSQFKDQELENAMYQAAAQKIQSTLLNSHHRQIPSHSNINGKEHSLYSDEQKKSVFLYSSSNDDIIQSQISQRISNLQSQSNRGSSKQSLQLFSNLNSNSSGGLNLQTSQKQNDHNMFKTTSSNLQISDMTLSLIRDGTQSSIVNFNPPPNNQFGGRNYLDTDAFEIKEEEDENCYTPMNQFFPQITEELSKKGSLQSIQNQIQFKNSGMFSSNGDNQNNQISISVVEDSFYQCDYDEYMEEKCSLSDNIQGDDPIGFDSKFTSNQKTINSHNNSQRKDMNSSISQNSYNQIKVQQCDSQLGNLQNNRTHFQTLSQCSSGLPPKQGILQFNSSTLNSDQRLGSAGISELITNIPSNVFQSIQTAKYSDIQSLKQLEKNGHQAPLHSFANQQARQDMLDYLQADCDNEGKIAESNERFVETFGVIEMRSTEQNKNFEHSGHDDDQVNLLKQSQEAYYSGKEIQEFQALQGKRRITEDQQEYQAALLQRKHKQNQRQGSSQRNQYYQQEQQNDFNYQNQQQDEEEYQYMNNQQLEQYEEINHQENQIQVESKNKIVEQEYEDSQQEQVEFMGQQCSNTQSYQQKKPKDVVQRLLYLQKQKQQKLEQQRIIKQNQEMEQCQKIPQISKNSRQILKEKEISIPAYLDMDTFFESQRRKEDLKRAIDQAKLLEVTGRPQISQKAQSLSREIKDLYDWQKEKQQKKEDMQRQKEEFERQEIETHQQKGKKYLCKESYKYLQNKENLYNNQRIEERLINIGVQNKIKKEQAVKHKVLEEIQIANQHHNKDKKISDKYLMRSRKRQESKQDLTLSHTDLRQISANKDRQDLYKKYYMEKKKEAEGRLLSTTQLQSAFNLSPLGKNYDPNAISRNNLYQAGPFSQTQSVTSFNQYMSIPSAGLPLSPVTNSNNQYQSFQAGINSTSQPFFDVAKSNNTCSFGNIQVSQSFRNASIQQLQPYNQNINSQPPSSLDIYQQMIIQAKTGQNSNGLLQKVDSQCASNASTSCFENLDKLSNQQSKVKLLPPKMITKKSENKIEQRQPLKSYQRMTTTSRSRSKSKECQSNAFRSISPRDQQVIGSGKIQNEAENDKFYERARKWSKERQKKIENQQEKLNLLETLKCTFRPTISEKSQKLFSPSSQDSRMKARFERGQGNYATFRHNSKGSKPSTFTKEMLLEQLMSSTISPLKEINESLNNDERTDPFLEQVITGQTSQNSAETTLKVGSGFTSINQASMRSLQGNSNQIKAYGANLNLYSQKQLINL